MQPIPTLRHLVFVALTLAVTCWIVTPAVAQDVTYTSINVQHSSAYFNKMHWSGEDEVKLRVTLWFPAGAPCESGSVEICIEKGTKTPQQAAQMIADAITAHWPGIEVSQRGRTVTVWGTDPDQVEGTPDKPKVQTTGTRKSAPKVSYFTNSL